MPGYIGKLEIDFIRNDIKEKEKIAAFLLDSAKEYPYDSVLNTIHILREYTQTIDSSIYLAKRMVSEWPIKFSLRYTLSNCLNMSGSREYRLEALKQRIIGCSMEIFKEKKRESISENYGRYQEIISRHFGGLDNIKNYIEGKRQYPSDHVKALMRIKRYADDEVLKILGRLEKIGDLAGLQYLVTKTPKLICIPDTNAISYRDVSKHFLNRSITYVVSADVLMELADWHKLQYVPWQFDAVEIKEVTTKIPIEIENMFSKYKGKPPSLTDKKVATLALGLKANPIISNDRDLWDSGMTYQIEKNFGHRIEVVRPANFARFLKKRGIIDQDMIL